MGQSAPSSGAPSSAAGGQDNTRMTEPTSGSQTQTEAQAQAPILRLRGEHTTRSGPRVQWDESVVDNEDMGKKSSKVCCIYHAPTPAGESSDESSSDSSSSSDESEGEGSGPSRRVMDADRVGKSGRGRKNPPDGRKEKRKPSPNAYEKIPKSKPRDDNHSHGGGAGSSCSP